MTDRIPLSAAVLAGGDSRRMGKDKAFLDLGGKPLIEVILDQLEELFEEVLVVANAPEKFQHLPVKIVSDIYREGSKNALRGIHAGLTAASYPSCLMVACDMPFLSGSLLRFMSQYAWDYELVIPHVDGYYQPLFAFYGRSTLEHIARALERGEHKIIDVYEGFHIKKITGEAIRVHDPQMMSFVNVNTAEDYVRAKTFFARANRQR